MFLKLFDSVRITEGVQRAVIFDTATGFLNYIPKSFAALLQNEKENYASLMEELDLESRDTLQQYIQFVQQHQLGTIIKTGEELSYFKKSLDRPVEVSNVDFFIFDLRPSDFNEDIVRQINQLNIKFVQLRILMESHINDVIKLFSKLSLFNNTSVNEVSIVLPYCFELEDCIITGNVIKSTIFLQFLFHSCPDSSFKTYGNIQISKFQKVVKIPNDCGCVNLKNLTIQRSFYNEALHHNTCLNKKIAIDENGFIRNCPSMPSSFGNIKETSLLKALSHPDFKKYWNLTKDEIDVCKDCEFRYLCTDCRAYTERGYENHKVVDRSKPLKCGYSPYTGVWEEWSTNPLKERAIKFYHLD